MYVLYNEAEYITYIHYYHLPHTAHILRLMEGRAN